MLPSVLILHVENKVEFLERQFQSEKLLFVHKKETKRSFELSLSICVFYRHIFYLEMQTFSVENHHMKNAHQPFCWWMTFNKGVKPASSATRYVADHLTFVGEESMGDLVWVSFFFPKSLELEIFALTYTPYSQMADMQEKTGA